MNSLKRGNIETAKSTLRVLVTCGDDDAAQAVAEAFELEDYLEGLYGVMETEWQYENQGEF